MNVACCEGNAYDDPKNEPRLGGTCLGLLLYSLVDVLAPRLKRLNQRHDALAVAILSFVILVALSLGIWALVRFVSGEGTLDACSTTLPTSSTSPAGSCPTGSAAPCRARSKNWPTP